MSKQIIEINGIKMEVDLSTAKRIDEFKIGDPVKILLTDGNQVHSGVIVGFEPFNRLPTITVAYMDVTYYSGGLKLAYINEKSREKYELVAVDENQAHMMMDRANVVEHLQRAVTKAEQELNDKKSQLDFFNKKFGCYFEEKQGA